MLDAPFEFAYQEELRDRLADIAVLRIRISVMQVAGVSGDVRRVLQLCRKAAEICEEEQCIQASTSPVVLCPKDFSISCGNLLHVKQ